MLSDSAHATSVDAWLDKVAHGLTTDRLVLAFERGLQAVWERAQRTLGDITLEAIGERVLYHAVAKYPDLSLLKLEPSGFSCQALHERASQLDEAEVRAGLRFVLVRFLAILGSLTAEILTSALREELSKVELDLVQPNDESPPSPTAGTSVVKEVKS